MIYFDDNLASSLDDRFLTSWYRTSVERNPIAWKTMKQIVVARSSMEAEY